MNDVLFGFLFLIGWVLSIIFVVFIPKIKRSLSQGGKTIFNSIVILYFLIFFFLPPILIASHLDDNFRYSSSWVSFLISISIYITLINSVYLSIIFLKYLYSKGPKYIGCAIIILSILAFILSIMYVFFSDSLYSLFNSPLLSPGAVSMGGAVLAGAFSLIFLFILLIPIVLLAVIGANIFIKEKDNSPIRIGSMMILQVIPVALFLLLLIIILKLFGGDGGGMGIEIIFMGICVLSIISAAIGTVITFIGLFIKNKVEESPDLNDKKETLDQINGGQQYNPLAILSFIFAVIFFPIGLILGVIAIIKIKKTGEKGKGLAIAGIIISIILPLLSFILTLFLIHLSSKLG